MNNSSQLFITVLKATGLYTDEVIARIISSRAENQGMSLIEAVLKFGGVKESEFLQKFSTQFGYDYINLEKVQPHPEVLQKLPASAVYQYNVLPIKFDGRELTVVSSDPFSTIAGDGLRLAAECKIKIALAPREEIDKAVKKFYGVGADAIEKMLEDGRFEVGDELVADFLGFFVIGNVGVDLDDSVKVAT